MDFLLVSLSVFLASAAGLWCLKARDNENQVGAQFVVTTTLLIVFYAVCFFSGVCSILNFLFRWVF